MIVKKLTGTIGAEIQNIDLSKEFGSEVFTEIEKALLENLVIVFRNQDLSPERQIQIGKMFGDLNTHPYISGNLTYPEIIDVVTNPNDNANFGGDWHADVTFLEEPDSITMLYGVEVPEYGGDTLFSNQILVYENMSEEMKLFINRLHAKHTVGLIFGKNGYYSSSDNSIKTKNELQAKTEVIHPLVVTHPVTGKKSLYVNWSYTNRIVELSTEESKAILKMLFSASTKEVFTCRIKWEPGTFVIWDNRSVIHNALHDYKDKRREMRRITVKGEKPR
jgi:taurine dioxygenase